MKYLFRIHIRPQGGTADMRTTFDYCLRNGILGVGWRTESQRNTKKWDKYRAGLAKLDRCISGETALE